MPLGRRGLGGPGPGRGGMGRARRTRRRRRRRRVLLVGGIAAVAIGHHNVKEDDVAKIEQHTGKSVDDLTDQEADKAIQELGIETVDESQVESVTSEETEEEVEE